MKHLLEEYLAQFKGEQVLYFPNPGNAGDSVIATATYQMFDRLGLSYVTPRLGSCEFFDRVVIYGGGGNLVGSGTYSARVIQATHKTAKRLVILPHTIKSVDSLLESFGSNVDVICREAVSYEYVARVARSANHFLMDDVAFSLDVANALKGAPILSSTSRILSFLRAKATSGESVPSFENVLRARRLPAIESLLASAPSSEQVYCLRTDGERTEMPITAGNLDLSSTLQFGVETKDVAFLSTKSLLGFLSRFSIVHTNRLHIAISSAILGLDVRFYANNYYKCRAVYDFSMAGKFGNVRWSS